MSSRLGAASIFQQADGKIRLLRRVVGWFTDGRRSERIEHEPTVFWRQSSILRFYRMWATLLVLNHRVQVSQRKTTTYAPTAEDAAGKSKTSNEALTSSNQPISSAIGDSRRAGTGAPSVISCARARGRTVPASSARNSAMCPAPPTASTTSLQ